MGYGISIFLCPISSFGQNYYMYKEQNQCNIWGGGEQNQCNIWGGGSRTNAISGEGGAEPMQYLGRGRGGDFTYISSATAYVTDHTYLNVIWLASGSQLKPKFLAYIEVGVPLHGIPSPFPYSQISIDTFISTCIII